MSNSNQAFMDSLYYNYYYSPISPINIPQFPTHSLSFYSGYTPTYSPMEQYTTTLPPAGSYYYGPVEYADEVAIILDSEDMFESFDRQTQMGRVNAGLSEKAIFKNLKTSRYKSACKAEEQEDEVCAVCQDEYKVNEMIGTLNCGHRYHATCIKQWLLQKKICPICRATVSDV